MARYINADDFRRELIHRQITTQLSNPRERHEIGCIVEMLDNAPTADVVPKSEVEKLSIELLHTKEDYGDLFETLLKTKNEVARKIFAEIERAIEDAESELEWGDTILDIERCLDQLKKKYTEEGIENE